MELVEIKKGEAFADSNTIAKKFCVKHADVVNKLKKLTTKLDDFRVDGFYPKYFQENRNYRGTDYTAYLINRDFFILLGMRFDTKPARKWQGQFIAGFNAMERSITAEEANKKNPSWLSDREQLKIGRKAETDVIKEFVEYATGQGSKSAKFYYKHITSATYSALDLMVQKKPNIDLSWRTGMPGEGPKLNQYSPKLILHEQGAWWGNSWPEELEVCRAVDPPGVTTGLQNTDLPPELQLAYGPNPNLRMPPGV